MLQLLGKRVVLDVVNDSHSDKLKIMVDPDKEAVVYLLMTAQEARVIVYGNFHQTMHGIVHADWFGIIVLQKVGIQLGGIFACHHNIPSGQRALQIILREAKTLWVHSHCKVLHQDNVEGLSLLVRSNPDANFESSQDLADARRAFLIERTAHVLEVWLSELAEHAHLIGVYHFQYILLVV
jgi:hypothetical protein